MSSATELDSVREQALGLEDGISLKAACPRCNRTDSFYITRDSNQLKFIDFSVNCGFKGIIESVRGSSNITTVAPIRQKKLFVGELTP